MHAPNPITELDRVYRQNVASSLNLLEVHVEKFINEHPEKLVAAMTRNNGRGEMVDRAIEKMLAQVEAFKTELARLGVHDINSPWLDKKAARLAAAYIEFKACRAALTANPKSQLAIEKIKTSIAEVISALYGIKDYYLNRI